MYTWYDIVKLLLQSYSKYPMTFLFKLSRKYREWIVTWPFKPQVMLWAERLYGVRGDDLQGHQAAVFQSLQVGFGKVALESDVHTCIFSHCRKLYVLLNFAGSEWGFLKSTYFFHHPCYSICRVADVVELSNTLQFEAILLQWHGLRYSQYRQQVRITQG